MILTTDQLSLITAIAAIPRFADVPFIILLETLVSEEWNKEEAVINLDAYVAIRACGEELVC